MRELKEPLLRGTGSVPAALNWDSPSYDVLKRQGLLRLDWRLGSFDELDLLEGNTTPFYNLIRKLACGACLLAPCCKFAEVPSGSIRKMEDGRGGFAFLGPSIHFYLDPFMRISGKNIPLNEIQGAPNGLIVQNGDRWIVVVPQGFVGLARDIGEPILLPPGLHQWRSETMLFERCVDLSTPVVQLGPYTLLTVDQGYEAVTQNNGKQTVLQGGAVQCVATRRTAFQCS